MTSLTERTHRSLIKPIEPINNLANITAREPSKTCQSCAAIIPDRRKCVNGLIKINYERIDLYPDFPELKASAYAGCGFCKYIRKTIRAKWAVRPMEEWGVGPLREKEGLWEDFFTAPWDCKVKIHNLLFFLEKESDTSPVPLDVMASTEEDDYPGMVISFGFEFGPATLLTSSDGASLYGEIGQRIGFKVFDSQDINSSKKNYQRRLPRTSTLSEANLMLVSSWISECKDSHAKCRLDTGLWAPTRLLYVGGSDNPRLVETSQEIFQKPYAALSHMWGDRSQLPPLRTILSKYEDMQKGIPMWMLSKNFADAVTVARQLGLQYIWIDSLCIIQDSLTDWQKEAVMMHKVYRYAEVTIVATSATSAHDGFLDRDLSMIPAAKIGYSLETDPPTSDSFILTTSDDAAAEGFAGDINGCEWNKRGWTHQERSLSTRILHFCKNKLYFECRSCLKSEENEPLQRMGGFQLWPRYEEWMESSKGPEQGDAHSTMKSRMYKIWKSTIMEYTKRSLTNGSDKLPAVQSIAAEMEAAINDAYISFAGIWRGNIDHDLLWHVHDGMRFAPTIYRAPSWSWASIDARIGWNDASVQPRLSHSSLTLSSFKVLEISDKTSDVLGSHFVKVKAYLRPLAFITECDNDDRWIYGTRGTFPYDIYIATATPTQPSAVKRSSFILPIKERSNAVEQGSFVKFAEGNLDLDDEDGLTGSQRMFAYLHIKNTSRPSGIILESVTDREGMWKRVGVAAVFSIQSNLIFEPAFAEGEMPVEISII